MAYNFTSEERVAAEEIISILAPDELPLLEVLMARPRWRDRLYGRSIGYGVDSVVAVIAPYVLLTVVWVKSVVGDEAKSVLESRLRELTRRVLRASESVPPPPTPPTNDPAQMREAIRKYAVDLGASESQAALLADAVVGSVLRTGDR